MFYLWAVYQGARFNKGDFLGRGLNILVGSSSSSLLSSSGVGSENTRPVRPSKPNNGRIAGHLIMFVEVDERER